MTANGLEQLAKHRSSDWIKRHVSALAVREIANGLFQVLRSQINHRRRPNRADTVRLLRRGNYRDWMAAERQRDLHKRVPD